MTCQMSRLFLNKLRLSAGGELAGGKGRADTTWNDEEHAARHIPSAALSDRATLVGDSAARRVLQLCLRHTWADRRSFKMSNSNFLNVGLPRTSRIVIAH